MSDATEAHMEEMDVVVQDRAPIKIRVGSKDVEILRARVRHGAVLSHCVDKIFSALGVKKLDQIHIKLDLNDPSVLTGLFTKCYPEVTKLMSTLTSLTVEEFEDLELDDGIAVATEVLLVNKDFFLTRVTPILAKSGVGRALLEGIAGMRRS